MTGEGGVVLPTHNEVETAPAIVSELLGFDTVSEIVVVDDDSPDGTAEQLRRRYGQDDRVRVIQRTEESGLSSAVLRGFDAADAEILVCMDADGQHPPGSAITCAQAVRSGADLAVGSRRAETGDVTDDWPLSRRLVSHGASGLAWAAVPPARALTDPMSGLFAIRADLVDAVRDQLRPTGYKILLELLARCPLEDVREVGYTFRERQGGGSNLGAPEYARYVEHLGRLVIPSRRGTGVTAAEEVAEDI